MRYCLAMLLVASAAAADPPEIVAVQAIQVGDSWRFDVTLRHPDTGWDHYADGWRVRDMTGRELGLRVLYHPHVTEQPFTRSLSGVILPEGTREVQIEARCLIDGWSAVTTVSLP